MSAGTKRRVVDTKGRNVGNLHTRLEEARAKRAKVLAVPKPANDAAPAPVKKPIAKIKPAPTKVPGKKILPPINPPFVETVSEPQRAKRRPIWLFALLGAAAVGFLAYAIAPSPAPIVTSDISIELTPALPSEATLTSATVWRDVQLQRPPTTTITANTASSLRPITEPIGPEPSVDAVQLVAMQPPADAQASGPGRIVDRASFRFAQPKAMPEPTAADTPATLAPDQQALFISLNVPSQTPRSVLDQLRNDAEHLGVDVGKSRTVNFQVKSTHVRYFHADDSARANDLASAIGANTRDFTSFKPQPAKGYVELWVAGRAKPVETRKGSSFGRDIRQLGSNIRNALQSISR